MQHMCMCMHMCMQIQMCMSMCMWHVHVHVCRQTCGGASRTGRGCGSCWQCDERGTADIHPRWQHQLASLLPGGAAALWAPSDPAPREPRRPPLGRTTCSPSHSVCTPSSSCSRRRSSTCAATLTHLSPLLVARPALTPRSKLPHTAAPTCCVCSPRPSRRARAPRQAAALRAALAAPIAVAAAAVASRAAAAAAAAAAATSEARAPHCTAAAPLRHRRCGRQHCRLTVPYPCVRRHGHSEGCGPPARTGPAAGPRPAPRTSDCVPAQPTATLWSAGMYPACALYRRCM